MRWSVALMLLATLPGTAGERCTPDQHDKVWLESALTYWRQSETTILKLPPKNIPIIYAINKNCTFRLKPFGRTSIWEGLPHGASAVLPGGQSIPLGPVSFAAPDNGGYFVMSLPSVWRASGVNSVLGLEQLMNGVILHELTHTRQFYYVTPALGALTKRYGLPATLNDDSLQDAFKNIPAYVASYNRERDLLYKAAVTRDDDKARRYAHMALLNMQARRMRWFVGTNTKWAQLDDIFLTMEGLGQWTAYAWYISPSGGHLPEKVVLPAVRRGGRYWSQDEGLALMLAVDRLLPDWQNLAFASHPLLAEALLTRAVYSHHQ